MGHSRTSKNIPWTASRHELMEFAVHIQQKKAAGDGPGQTRSQQQHFQKHLGACGQIGRTRWSLAVESRVFIYTYQCAHSLAVSFAEVSCSIFTWTHSDSFRKLYWDAGRKSSWLQCMSESSLWHFIAFTKLSSASVFSLFIYTDCRCTNNNNKTNIPAAGAPKNTVN